MRNRWAFAVAMVVIGIIVAATVWRSRDARQPPAVVAPVDGSMETGPNDVPAGGRTPARGSLELPQERAARIAKIREAQEVKAAQVVAAGKRTLETAFASEKPNPAWASAKERELEGFVVNPQMESINALPSRFEVQCKSVTCRIEADFPTTTALDDWTTLFLTNNGGTLPRTSMTRIQQPDGTVRLIMLGSTR